MHDVPDPDWYVEHVLIDAEPRSGLRVDVRKPAAEWQAWWRARPALDEPMITARRQGFVLSTAQLAELGISRSASPTALRRGRWWSPAVGTVAPMQVSEPGVSAHLLDRRRHALKASAAVLRRPEHIVAARSATILHGLPTVRVPASVELAAPNPDGLGQQAPTHAYGAQLLAYAVTCWSGVMVTTVARTLVDLGRHDRRDAMMAADAALREGLITRADIDIELADATGWPGVRQAREVLALGDPRAESPLESITRLALHDDGFPAPEPQFWIGRDRVDFAWPRYRVVLEADGKEKYSGEALWEERKREARLRGAHWKAERVIWSDVLSGWADTSALLRPYFTR
jgi:hypothetical protein